MARYPSLYLFIYVTTLKSLGRMHRPGSNVATMQICVILSTWHYITTS